VAGVRARPAAPRGERPGDGDSEGGWVLDGTAHHVVDADRAETLAVVATLDGGSGGSGGSGGTGVGVFVVPAGEPGVAVTRRPAIDGSLHVADVRLDGVAMPAPRSWVGPEVGPGVERARQVAVTGLAAVMVGASQRILELVLDHVRERRQFDVPIGSFQAVKHMAVDVYVAIERARALCHFAGLAIAEDDSRRAVAASMAKAAAGDAQRLAVTHGIQLFGGLGWTWENDLQIYVRRAKAGELLLGTGATHRAKVARAVLAEAGARGGAGA
jgi:alkylation response protein AidB-like acyl-CoA dehydrogenase